MINYLKCTDTDIKIFKKVILKTQQPVHIDSIKCNQTDTVLNVNRYMLELGNQPNVIIN